MFASVIPLVVLLGAPGITADEMTVPVTIHSIGPKAFRIRIADGFVVPCDSASNVKLYEGKLEPGATVSLTSHAATVCVQQTNEDWPDTGWSNGWLAAGTCQGWPSGKSKYAGRCTKSSDGVTRVTLRSTVPVP